MTSASRTCHIILSGQVQLSPILLIEERLSACGKQVEPIRHYFRTLNDKKSGNLASRSMRSQGMLLPFAPLGGSASGGKDSLKVW